MRYLTKRDAMNSRLRTLPISLLFCAGFGLSTAHAQTPPSPSVGLPLPDRSLTTQDDSASIEVNPAGLGFMVGPELSYAFTIANDDFEGVAPEGHALFFGTGFGGFGLGFGVQWLDQPELGEELHTYRKYTFATAL